MRPPNSKRAYGVAIVQSYTYILLVCIICRYTSHGLSYCRVTKFTELGCRWIWPVPAPSTVYNRDHVTILVSTLLFRHGDPRSTAHTVDLFKKVLDLFGLSGHRYRTMHHLLPRLLGLFSTQHIGVQTRTHLTHTSHMNTLSSVDHWASGAEQNHTMAATTRALLEFAL